MTLSRRLKGVVARWLARLDEPVPQGLLYGARDAWATELARGPLTDFRQIPPRHECGPICEPTDPRHRPCFHAALCPAGRASEGC